MKYFDEDSWRRATRRPDWYIKLFPEMQDLRERWEDEDNPDADDIKQAVRGFFEAALGNGTLALGTSGPNLDAERRPIDTIVIHHTSSSPGYRLPYMNAVQLLNVYVPNFNDSTTTEDRKSLKGLPLWSNHVRNGRPVFYLYHWLMRMDGSFERLLNDDELGWHAANWDINCRSVAICLDNNYEASDPRPETLSALARFISENYPAVKTERVFGHSEVSLKGTNCPGNNFINGWKNNLLGLLRR